MIAKIGKKMDTIVITIEAPVSIMDTTGFATPPVVAVEANLVVAEDPAIAVAVPPPAIIANDHVINGLKSETVDNITAVPASAASGTAILSNTLSTYGMK